MRDNLKFLIKSILAGIMIGIGGTIFLSLENKIVGAFMFAIGLFAIVSMELNLFTGKIGYIFNRKPIYLIEVLITLVGNFIGTNIVGFILRFTRIYNNISAVAQNICTIKVNDNVLSILILSMFCGTLMYIAVNGYKTLKDDLGRNLGVFLCVAVFILCGFEHCVANMYYFAVAGMWTGKSLLYLLVMILGNSMGGVLIPLCEKLINVTQKNETKTIQEKK